MVNKRKFIRQLRADWEDSTGEKLSTKKAKEMIGEAEWEDMRGQEQYVTNSKGKRRKILW
jgi:hypothetical protein